MPKTKFSISKLPFSQTPDTFNLLSTKHHYLDVQSVHQTPTPKSQLCAGKLALKNKNQP